MIKETSMIKEILDKTNYSTKDTVFFDDMEWNTILYQLKILVLIVI
jgi:hypothetical protein